MTQTALISVSDKTGLKDLAKFLIEQNIKIISTGGTYQHLMREVNNPTIVEIKDYTFFPEILDGRVKTLHPKIYGGILAKRNNLEHLKQLENLDINTIDLVVCNLYPFEEVIKNPNLELDEAIENIDIGGHSLIRAAAKNFKDVCVLTSPNDYQKFMNKYQKLTVTHRRRYAERAFIHIAKYDIFIANYLSQDSELDTILRIYQKDRTLKYGCNPQQKLAGLYRNEECNQMPFEVIHGNPGYINLLDAIYGWNLVSELSTTLQLPSAASFKHTSPAGVGVGIPLSNLLAKIYDVDQDIDATSCAFIRARNADPMSSYGDFIAISEIVEEATAKLISREVSDGIVSPGYTKEALEILKKKKGGNYLILKGNYDSSRSFVELREMHGLVLVQNANHQTTNYESLNNIITRSRDLPTDAQLNLIIANTLLKYTQSNSVAFVYDGQAIGIGAGQQSRIDCVKLAKRKAETWFLRQHPKTLALLDMFKERTKRQEKVNGIVQYLENDFSPIDFKNWQKFFNNSDIKFISLEEKKEYLSNIKGVSLASDAFFPFRDNIDVAAKIGVKYVVQPGGSIADQEIVEACNQYGMTMCLTGSQMRMFLH